jgi:hypothetical protein
VHLGYLLEMGCLLADLTDRTTELLKKFRLTFLAKVRQKTLSVKAPVQALEIEGQVVHHLNVCQIDGLQKIPE